MITTWRCPALIHAENLSALRTGLSSAVTPNLSSWLDELRKSQCPCPKWLWKSLDSLPVSSKREKTGSIRGPGRIGVISLPNTELWHGQPLVPLCHFQFGLLTEWLKTILWKMWKTPAVWLPSRCLLGPCNVPTGSGNEAWKVTKHDAEGNPKGSLLQFLVLVVRICGIYWHKHRVPYLALVLPLWEGVLTSVTNHSPWFLRFFASALY